MKIESMESVICRKMSQQSQPAISGEMKEKHVAKATQNNTFKERVVFVISSALLFISVVIGIYLMRKMNLNVNLQTLIIWLMVGLLMVVFVSFILILMISMVKGLRRKMIEPVQLPINSSEILKNPDLARYRTDTGSTKKNEVENAHSTHQEFSNVQETSVEDNADEATSKRSIPEKVQTSVSNSSCAADIAIERTTSMSTNSQLGRNSQSDIDSGVRSVTRASRQESLKDKPQVTQLKMRTPNSNRGTFELGTSSNHDMFAVPSSPPPRMTRSKHKSRRIKLYRNVIENETYRMMKSIDSVESEAKQLFGLERTQIFFDLLAAKSFPFVSAGATSEFVPNMDESAVRQNVISFFEHSHETMNQLTTLFWGCPDSKELQQMPEQNFISLIQSIIESLPETKTKQRKRLSSERNTFTMIDLEEFERELGEDIPEVVLDKLRHGDEMVVHSFVDQRELKHQKEDTNRPIHCVFFPSDCRLFIYIPTEHGSYWHYLDMQRAYRTSQRGK